MSKNYKQLNSVQRYQIEALLLNGTTQKQIANIIGVSASTISRELHRNIAKRGRGAHEYHAKNAQRRTDQRHSEKAKCVRFTYVMKTYARKKLAEEKLRTPLEMEYDASWSIDKKNAGTEKTFCCINARARDFAKIGRLYLNKGNWNGKQIVSQKWVEESTKVDTTDGSVDEYQYQWWLPSTTGDYMAEGILGQYIYVNPSNNLVIVRMGKNPGRIEWPDLFILLAKYSNK